MKKIDKAIKELRIAITEEKIDFLEENTELSDFQQGVLFGMKLALVKIKGVKEND